MEIIIYLLAVVILCVILLGLLLKVVMIVLNILSLPTYIGLIYFKDVHNIKFLKINKPPKNGLLNLIIKIFSSSITLILIDSVYNLIKYISYKDSFTTKVITGDLIPFSYAIMVVVSLVGIYTINYFSEENKDDTLSKIDKLDLNPFLEIWK